MTIQCEHCGGESFHLMQLPDGTTQLVCFNYGDHATEMEEAEDDGT